MSHFHSIDSQDAASALPVVRRIGAADLKDALSRGVADFLAMPSSLLFLAPIYAIYPIIGIAFANNAPHLLFPIMSGFALFGSFAAIGLYEVSRRRELGLEVSWTNAFDVRHSPSISSILALGLLLLVLFICWLAASHSLYDRLFGPAASASYRAFFYELLTTPKGWTLIVLGNAIGFTFAVVALSVSVVSFPLLLDRDVGLVTAISTSVRVVLANPVTIALWGLIVATSLAIGTLLLFIGLAFVVPILAHATWHLYRKAVEPVPVR